MTTQFNTFQVKIWSWQTVYHGSLLGKITHQTELHQNIQNIHCNSDHLNIIKGAIE